MKEYFSHDLHARNDRKLARLFKVHRLAGVGAYWCIIEMLHEENGYILLSEIENISFELRVKSDFILNILENFELFSCDSEKFWSESANSRIEKKKEKSVKARESVNNRWKTDTNVLRSYSDQNTIKVNKSKVNESKVNNTVVDATASTENLQISSSLFWKDLVKVWFEFYKKNYLTEPTFNAAAGKQLKNILTRLEKKTKEKGYEWTEAHAADCLAQFLERARSDEWLKRNFSLANLDSKFDIIITPKNEPVNNTKQQSGKITSEQLDQAFANFYSPKGSA